MLESEADYMRLLDQLSKVRELKKKLTIFHISTPLSQILFVIGTDNVLIFVPNGGF